MAHLLAGVAPLFLMCDQKDLQAVSEVRSPFTQAPTVFLYERSVGGVGLAGGLFKIHQRLIAAALDLAQGCECEDGCPACVGPALEDATDSKLAAIVILERLIDDGPS